MGWLLNFPSSSNFPDAKNPIWWCLICFQVVRNQWFFLFSHDWDGKNPWNQKPNLKSKRWIPMESVTDKEVFFRFQCTGWIAAWVSDGLGSGIKRKNKWRETRIENLATFGGFENLGIPFFLGGRNMGSQTLDVLYMVELANISSRFRTNFWVGKCR